MGAIDCLKTVLYPYLLFSSEKVHNLLECEGGVADGTWDFRFP